MNAAAPAPADDAAVTADAAPAPAPDATPAPAAPAAPAPVAAAPVVAPAPVAPAPVLISAAPVTPAVVAPAAPAVVVSAPPAPAVSDALLAAAATTLVTGAGATDVGGAVDTASAAAVTPTADDHVAADGAGSIPADDAAVAPLSVAVDAPALTGGSDDPADTGSTQADTPSAASGAGASGSDAGTGDTASTDTSAPALTGASDSAGPDQSGPSRDSGSWSARGPPAGAANDNQVDSAPSRTLTASTGTDTASASSSATGAPELTLTAPSLSGIASRSTAALVATATLPAPELTAATALVAPAAATTTATGTASASTASGSAPDGADGIGTDITTAGAIDAPVLTAPADAPADLTVAPSSSAAAPSSTGAAAGTDGPAGTEALTVIPDPAAAPSTTAATDAATLSSSPADAWSARGPPAGSVLITAATGGTITTGGATLTFAPGALPSDAYVLVTPVLGVSSAPTFDLHAYDAATGALIEHFLSAPVLSIYAGRYRADAPQVLYLAPDGSAQAIASTYDASTGIVTAGLPHFSVYATTPVGGVLTLNLPNDGNHAISVVMNGANVEIDVNGTGPDVYTGVTSIVINGSADDDTLTVDQSVVLAAIPVTFDGGAGNDTLVGPDLAVRWVLSSLGAGGVQLAVIPVDVISFTGVENLQGGAGLDAFVLTGDGGVTGTIDGGSGTDELTLGDFLHISGTFSLTPSIQSVKLSTGATVTNAVVMKLSASGVSVFIGSGYGTTGQVGFSGSGSLDLTLVVDAAGSRAWFAAAGTIAAGLVGIDNLTLSAAAIDFAYNSANADGSSVDFSQTTGSLTRLQPLTGATKRGSANTVTVNVFDQLVGTVDQLAFDSSLVDVAADGLTGASLLRFALTGLHLKAGTTDAGVTLTGGSLGIATLTADTRSWTAVTAGGAGGEPAAARADRAPGALRPDARDQPGGRDGDDAVGLEPSAGRPGRPGRGARLAGRDADQLQRLAPRDLRRRHRPRPLRRALGRRALRPRALARRRAVAFALRRRPARLHAHGQPDGGAAGRDRGERPHALLGDAHARLAHAGRLGRHEPLDGNRRLRARRRDRVRERLRRHGHRRPGRDQPRVRPDRDAINWSDVSGSPISLAGARTDVARHRRGDERLRRSSPGGATFSVTRTAITTGTYAGDTLADFSLTLDPRRRC